MVYRLVGLWIWRMRTCEEMLVLLEMSVCEKCEVCWRQVHVSVCSVYELLMNAMCVVYGVYANAVLLLCVAALLSLTLIIVRRCHGCVYMPSCTHPTSVRMMIATTMLFAVCLAAFYSMMSSLCFFLKFEKSALCVLVRQWCCAPACMGMCTTVCLHPQKETLLLSRLFTIVRTLSHDEHYQCIMKTTAWRCTFFALWS